MIRGFVAEGRTVLLSWHLLDEVEKICDQVAIVDRGRVVAQGSIDELAAGGHQTIHIATSNDAQALAILTAHRAVASTTVSRGGIHVTLHPDAAAGAGAVDDLSHRLTTGQLTLRRFEPVRASLEERFLEITSHPKENA